MGRRTRWGLVLPTVVLVLAVVSGAQATPGPRVSVSVDQKAVFSGQSVTATARASTTCSWLIVWGAEREVRTGRSASAAFVAPVVTRRTEVPLRARCFARTAPDRRALPADRVPSDGATPGQRLVVTVPPSGEDTVTVTVLPPGNGVSPPQVDGGTTGPTGLPGTGGPRWELLGLGAAALVAGTLALRMARRRTD